MSVVVTLYLRAPDVTVAVVLDDDGGDYVIGGVTFPYHRGVIDGLPAFSAAEMASVLARRPSPEEFRVLCHAKTVFGGAVVLAVDDEDGDADRLHDYDGGEEIVS